MKKIIFGQTWAIVVAVLATVTGGLIVNSFTKWWTALANITIASWAATSEGLARIITYKVPIWAVVAVVALVALTWYLGRKIGRAPQISTPNFLDYRQDVFDGVLCRWEYIQPSRGSPYRIENILCFCQYCDFVIGRPNQHEQKCHSCSRRAVKSDDPPFYNQILPWSEITGYKRRENATTFENFIVREIDRRIRTGEWSSPEKTGIT